MRKFKIYICSILIFMAAGYSACFAQELPKHAGGLSDFANIIDSENKDKIAKIIEEIKEKTSINITIATIVSTAPYGADEYIQKLFDFWEINKKPKGILILLVLKERQTQVMTTESLKKMFPENVIDMFHYSIVNPCMAEGRYGEGAYNGIAFISSIIAKKEKVVLENVKEAPKVLPAVIWEENIFFAEVAGVAFVIFSIILVLVFIHVYHARQLRSKHSYHDIYWWTGGYGGGSGFSIGGFGGFGGGFS